MTPFDIQTLRAQEPQLRRLARAIVGEAYADDVVQDAWTAALSHRGDAPANWGAWLNGVTRNLAWKRRKRDGNARARAAHGHGPAESSVGSPVDDLVARIEEKHVLERAVLDLEEPYRSVLLWRYYEDLTVEEVSRRAGTVPSTTRTHLQRGLDKLRARLKSEKGPEWRMTLIPFLRPKAAALKTAAAAGASGVGTIMAFKIFSAAIVAVALGIFGLGKLQDDQGQVVALTDPEGTPSAPYESTGQDALEMAPPEVGGAAVRSEETAIATEAAPAAEPPPAQEATPLQLVDSKSGQPLPGVTFEVSYYVRKRRLFFTRTESVSTELTTDEEGRAILMAATDSQGQVDGNPVTATFQPAPPWDTDGPTRIQHLSLLRILDDGTLQLSPPASSHAFWVRLPQDLDQDAQAALDGKLTAQSYGRLSPLGPSIAPVAVNGRDLLFVTPSFLNDAPWKEQGTASLHLATTDEGPSFRADIRHGQDLDDGPTLAVRSGEMVQRLTVLEETTGHPINGAHLSIRGPSEDRRGPGPTYAWSVTDKEGQVRLIGVPSGPLIIVATCEGYEPLTLPREFDRFEDVTVRLAKKGNLRAVSVTLMSKKGSAPSIIDLAAYDDSDSGPFERASSIECRQKGAGWTGTVVLNHVPARAVFLDLSFYTKSYGRIAPIEIHPDQSAITIDVGEETPVVNLRLRVHGGLEIEYRQRIEPGRESSFGGPHSDGDIITAIPDDDRPLHWTVQAPGYLPVTGTRADFAESTHAGQRCYELSPQLVEGMGWMLKADEMTVPEGAPFHFTKTTPLEGVRFTQADTGELIGISDASGYVVVAGSAPPGKVTATHNGTSKTYRPDARTRTLRFTFMR